MGNAELFKNDFNEAKEAAMDAIKLLTEALSAMSASADNTLKVWDVNNGEWECVATLEGHANSVRCAASTVLL